jgi:hypothetical protein
LKPVSSSTTSLLRTVVKSAQKNTSKIGKEIERFKVSNKIQTRNGKRKVEPNLERR